jgi:hypothetical protein
MCNNDRAIPYPVVACKADFETAIQKSADPNTNSPVFTYTYIVSADPAPPDLPENINWLPWGATDIPKNLIFRIILPQDTFILTDYYPQGVFCDRANLANLSACFPAGARISSAAGSH